MALEKLTPTDPRVEKKTIDVNGRTYHYRHGNPDEGTDKKGTVFLVHGFPDTSFGWRWQIPFFQSLGYRVIAPDMLGYGETSSPEDVESFSLKGMCDDIAAICAELLGPETQIILGGHDWGGFLVWRVALWHPGLVRGVFSICTPYTPPRSQYIDLKYLVDSGKLPNFGYQLQLMSGDVEKNVSSEESIRQFVNGMYGAKGPEGEKGFSVEKGVLFENLPKLGVSPILSAEEVDEYVGSFVKSTLRGPMNWYRTRKIIFEEEKPLAEKDAAGQVVVPCLFVQASKDAALPPAMSAGMDQYFKDLTTKTVDTFHWAQTMAPHEVNEILKEWIGQKVDAKGEEAKAAL